MSERYHLSMVVRSVYMSSGSSSNTATVAMLLTVLWSHEYAGFPKWLPYEASRTTGLSACSEMTTTRLVPTKSRIADVGFAGFQNENGDGGILAKASGDGEAGGL